MQYAMSTRSRVPTSNPADNEFGHGYGSAVFLYLEDAWNPGKKQKVYVTYGYAPNYQVGRVVQMTQDTGMGHRYMRDHRIVAIRLSETEVAGTLPAVKSLPLWVAK